MQLLNGKRACLLLILPALLSGCERAASSKVQPDVPHYAREFQAKAADELMTFPPPCPRDVVILPCSATYRVVIDTLTMRDQIRAIKN